MASKHKFLEGEKVLCFHGPSIYEAKCLKSSVTKDKHVHYLIHYTGWNKMWDEWVPESRVLKYNEANVQRQKEVQRAHPAMTEKTPAKKRKSDAAAASATPAREESRASTSAGKDVKTPTSSVKAAETQSEDTPADSRSDHPTWPDLNHTLGKDMKTMPTPVEAAETQSTDTPADSGSDQPKSSSCKRKIVYDIYDPELDLIENDGSDQDSDTGDENDVNEFLCPWPVRIINTSIDVETAPADCNLPSSHHQPSSSASTNPPPSASAPSGAASASVPLDEATYGPHSLNEFVWEALPTPAIPPQQRREKFTASVGPLSSFSSPYEAFVSIWDRSMIENIVVETNRYAEQTLEVALMQGDLGGHSRKLLFKETDADELYVFFALLIAIGIVIKADVTEYWSVNDDVLDTPNFGRYMTYTRFHAIAQMLHFVDNEIDISHLSKSEAKIAKLAPVVQHLNEKFQALYQLGQCVALDESLTQWKGRLNINQFIKTKAARQGVKTYEVCDSSSGYLWRFKVHAGRSVEKHELGHTTSLVLELLKGLENKGHTIFMDNYYNCPLLARLLKSQGFDCVGTLRLNREDVPADLKDLVKRPLAADSVHGATSGDVDVLVWRDRRVVSLISTYHGAALSSKDGKKKPALVHDYNAHMGGVDKKDQMLSAYPIERKRTAVWYKKIFRRLLNASVLNAFILHRESPAPKHPQPHFTKHRQFRINLVKEILAAHCQERHSEVRPSGSGLKIKFSAEVVRHFPKVFPHNEKLKQCKRGRCGVCRKRTKFQCTGCNIALCFDTCFLKFHS